MQTLQQQQKIPEFTPREKQILSLLARAYKRKDIYETLGIAERTLNTHMHHIYIKTGFSGNVELIAWTRQNGFGPAERVERI